MDGQVVSVFLVGFVGVDLLVGIAVFARGVRIAHGVRHAAPRARPAPMLQVAPTRVGARLAATALVIVAIAGLAGGITWAGFSATTNNPANSFSAGTVALSDNDSGSAMLALTNAVPGNSDTSCITVTYSGTADANVRLYGSTTGTGLDAFLDLTVTRGTGAAGFDNCTGFTADTTNYTGAGSGVVYNGTVQGFADNFAAGIVDPTSGTPEAWSTGEAHVYRFVVGVQDNNSAQGLNATQAFTWEARNV